jgi:hypothetical protein
MDVGPREKKLKEQFQRRMGSLPWVLGVVAGTEDISDITEKEFLGLIGLLTAVHQNTLLLAREIDEADPHRNIRS